MPGPNSSPKGGKTSVKRTNKGKNFASWVPAKLADRIAAWNGMTKASSLTTTTKIIDGNAHRKPGSQNRNK